MPVQCGNTIYTLCHVCIYTFETANEVLSSFGQNPRTSDLLCRAKDITGVTAVTPIAKPFMVGQMKVLKSYFKSLN